MLGLRRVRRGSVVFGLERAPVGARADLVVTRPRSHNVLKLRNKAVPRTVSTGHLRPQVLGHDPELLDRGGLVVQAQDLADVADLVGPVIHRATCRSRRCTSTLTATKITSSLRFSETFLLYARITSV